ncbi:MAG: ATP-binding cassette domain-containing protein [Verrucomicrobiia bacterium]
MIKVENLTKRYPGVTAIQHLSFEVGSREVVGFLGPNGAGKSTTMRILSGYMPATSGRAWVAGYDVLEESFEARRRVGYMAENVPLYPDMRVLEYLRYRAELKGVRRRLLKERLNEVAEQCGLENVMSRIIGTLSKGYRQRVGLADALVHAPDILILDEPTIGLDPTQIRQVRELIKALARRHTILLSTHILSEVEAICERILIISRGRISASGTVDTLVGGLRSSGSLSLEWSGPTVEASEEALRQLAGVRDVTSRSLEDGWVGNIVRTEAGADVRAEVFALAARKNWPLRELASRRITLEDVFVEVTES